ncbi:MAG: flippase-like domain-containing protein [Bacteroidales bacterium]|nr:flippase-like domain-containing protein [Bacteroidales bacterium]
MKTKYQWAFRVLLYLSIAFLLWYLVKFDYLSLAGINIRWGWLVVSALLLWAGFFFSTIGWKQALKLHGYPVSTKLALVSHGLSVFAKYVPGKVWVILGRAAYVTAQNGTKAADLSFISLKEQLLYILLGLMVSFLPVLIYFENSYWAWIILVTILGLCMALFVKPLHDIGEKLGKAIFKKHFDLPFLSLGLSLKLSCYILVYWAFYSVGFYFLVVSLTSNASFAHVFAFPMAVCYGVLALFTPGGIGVREGLLTAFLTATGVELQMAVTISVISRLWFISGEVFLFVLALLFKRAESK